LNHTLEEPLVSHHTSQLLTNGLWILILKKGHVFNMPGLSGGLCMAFTLKLLGEWLVVGYKQEALFCGQGLAYFELHCGCVLLQLGCGAVCALSASTGTVGPFPLCVQKQRQWLDTNNIRCWQPASGGKARHSPACCGSEHAQGVQLLIPTKSTALCKVGNCNKQEVQQQQLPTHPVS
jgi:hypothetical protein